MRPIQLADLDMAARVLLCADPLHRVHLARDLCEDAGTADRYRKHIGQPHPTFGVGTLLSATARYDKSARPGQCHSEYLKCLKIVIDQVIATRHDHTA